MTVTTGRDCAIELRVLYGLNPQEAEAQGNCRAGAAGRARKRLPSGLSRQTSWAEQVRPHPAH